MEKIIKNILDNPGIEKFYKIKTDSQHFKKHIEIYRHSLAIIELLGFTKTQIEGVDYYCLDASTKISFIEGLYFDYQSVANKYF